MLILICPAAPEACEVEGTVQKECRECSTSCCLRVNHALSCYYYIRLPDFKKVEYGNHHSGYKILKLGKQNSRNYDHLCTQYYNIFSCILVSLLTLCLWYLCLLSLSSDIVCQLCRSGKNSVRTVTKRSANARAEFKKL